MSSNLQPDYYLPDFDRLDSKVILFDFDDTLGDISEMRKQISSEFPDFFYEEIRRNFGKLVDGGISIDFLEDFRSFYKTCHSVNLEKKEYGVYFPEFLVDLIRAYYDNYRAINLDQIPLAEETVKAFRGKGYSTQIFTNGPEEGQGFKINKIELSSLVDGVIYTGQHSRLALNRERKSLEKTVIQKPDPRIYPLAEAEALDYALVSDVDSSEVVSNNQIIFVDDRPENVLGAIIHGWTGIYFHQGSYEELIQVLEKVPEEFKPRFYYVTQLKDLYNF